MNAPLKRYPVRVLVLIINTRLAQRAEKLFEQGRLPLRYQLRGQGTAPGEITDALGLGGTAKVLLVSMMPKPYADAMAARLEKELGIGRPGTGVAFTTAITGISALAMQLLDESARKELHDTMENDVRQMAETGAGSLVVASVNQGYSEEVMDAARQAGARGGTVLHARQMGAEEAMRFWGITIQEERELVLILAGRQAKLGIMRAISEKCGMQSPAKGFVFSAPLDTTIGLADAAE